MAVSKKTKLKWLCLLMVLALLGGNLGSAWAQSATPADGGPRMPRQPATAAADAAALAPERPSLDPNGLSLPTLKAVLVVGPIDTTYGASTLAEVAVMEQAADELRLRGVMVSTFYPPYDSWATIKLAASGAQFFMYRGHGVSDGNTPPNVGGLWLTEGYISPDAIRGELRLAKNAIVMMYACWSAGSSSDDVTTSSSEALRRVIQYSDPFFSAGAGGYYANWLADAFPSFARSLLSGQTLGKAYKTYSDYTASSAEFYTHPSDASRAVWLDKDYFDGGYKYDNAFVGQADATLSQLFSTSLVATPNPIERKVKVNGAAETSTLYVKSSSNVTFNWKASLVVDGSWASLDLTSGVSGQKATLTIDPTGLAKGTYSGTIRVSTSASGVQQATQDVPLTLVVTDGSTIFVPMMTK